MTQPKTCPWYIAEQEEERLMTSKMFWAPMTRKRRKPKRTKARRRTASARSTELCMAEIDLRLFNYANGCRGHYCVGRESAEFGGPYCEFWNAKLGDFCSAGTVYAGQSAALLAMSEIADVLRGRMRLTAKADVAAK